MKTFKVVIPLNDQYTFNLDINTQLDGPEIQAAIQKLNYAHLLYDSLKKLVKEMEPLNLITQSENYREAIELLGVLENL
jgi:hypothetical protein